MRFSRYGVTFLACVLACGAARAGAELPAETPHVITLGASNGHRIYLDDSPVAHAVDGKIHVLDGDSFKLLGQIPNGFFGVMSLSADGATLYSGTTYFSRGDHGARTDVVELFDTATLALMGEIVLPPHRAQSTGYAAYLQESAGGTFLFAQNATPASSVTVIDLPRRKVLGEIPTAGCIGIYPSPAVAGRFSSLCGDGSAITVTLDADGHEAARHRSQKFFDPDGDALFIAGVDAWPKTIFVSFLGHVQAVDFSGPTAMPDAAWAAVTGADAADNWRPGGYQIAAYDQGSGQLYIAMHAHGVEGSHKAGADQIWRLDVATHGLKARGPGHATTYMAISPGPHPVLVGANFDTGIITRFDPDTLQPTGASPDHGVVEGGGLMAVR